MIDAMPVAPAEISAAELAHILEDFFAEYPQAAVLEDGRVLFDMAAAHFSISAERERCLLHLWSDERNVVRTVCGLKTRQDSLRLETRRFGQTRPQVLELVANRDRRSPSSREAARTKYLRLLDRVLPREFPDWKLERLRTAADLEHSFGPAYARGMLVKGTAACALIAVNGEEPQSTIDGILTLGVLWLAYCREHGEGRRLCEGLKVVVPAGASHVVRGRMPWLNASIAKWELYELDERAELLERVDVQDCGNLRSALVHAFHPETALERSRKGIDRVLGLLKPGLRGTTEVRARAAGEISFALHGLEFARIRSGFAQGTFAREDEITFGAGANETRLTEENEALFCDLTQRLFEHRHANGSARNPLYRLQPERWLECCLRQDIAEIEPSLRTDTVYSQVPAFAAGDRAMLDLLTVTHGGRLAVLELKADDDLHLPFQALDYWARVRQLHREGAFAAHGYFPGIELSDEPPLLYLVAPSLRVHPSTDTVLRHLSAEVSWELIGLNEDWRKRRQVVLRKRSGAC
ncbi:MAG TPA: hypothetical protein VFW25_08200 [Silvibacterium sp.]|nr:hypothetical protein [Silvibacterium sp.]